MRSNEMLFLCSFAPKNGKSGWSLQHQKRLERAVINMKRGIFNVAAATCLGSPNCLIKNVSAILYDSDDLAYDSWNCKRTRIALGIGMLQNNNLIFFLSLCKHLISPCFKQSIKH